MSNHILECGSDEVGFRNTGAKEQCLEGALVRPALATLDQQFASVTSAKTLADWKTDRDLKKIFPLFDADDLANANVEDTLKELRRRTIITAAGKKKITYNSYISLCSHYALKAFNGKKMRFYGFTDKQEITATTPDGVAVEGETVLVTIKDRVRPTVDTPGYTPIEIEFLDKNEHEDKGVVLRPDWSDIDLDGIFDVTVNIISASSTSIVFEMLQGCGAGNEAVTTFVDGDVLLKNASGVTQSPTFTEANTAGRYTFTGTGFANNFTISLDGVVAKTEASYETPVAGVVSGI
jgi:hypothetical protein